MCYRPSPGRRSSFSVSASTLSTARALTAPTRLNSRSDCTVFRCPFLPSTPSSSVRCTQFLAQPAGVQRKRRCSQGLRLPAAPSCFCPTLCGCSALLPGYRTRELLNLLILKNWSIRTSYSTRLVLKCPHHRLGRLNVNAEDPHVDHLWDGVELAFPSVDVDFFGKSLSPA